jgi:hypothetical protein
MVSSDAAWRSQLLCLQILRMRYTPAFEPFTLDCHASGDAAPVGSQAAPVGSGPRDALAGSNLVPIGVPGPTPYPFKLPAA